MWNSDKYYVCLCTKKHPVLSLNKTLLLSSSPSLTFPSQYHTEVSQFSIRNVYEKDTNFTVIRLELFKHLQFNDTILSTLLSQTFAEVHKTVKIVTPPETRSLCESDLCFTWKYV